MKLWLICSPRSLSVCITRVLERTGDFSVFHEPFSGLYFKKHFGPVSGLLFHPESFASPEEFYEALEGAAKDRQNILIKEMAFACRSSLLPAETAGAAGQKLGKTKEEPEEASGEREEARRECAKDDEQSGENNQNRDEADEERRAEHSGKYSQNAEDKISENGFLGTALGNEGPETTNRGCEEANEEQDESAQEFKNNRRSIDSSSPLDDPEAVFLFLFREPGALLHSFRRKLGWLFEPTALREVAGFSQILELYAAVKSRGRRCLLVETSNLEGALDKIFDFLGLPRDRSHLEFAPEDPEVLARRWRDQKRGEFFRHWHGEAAASTRIGGAPRRNFDRDAEGRPTFSEMLPLPQRGFQEAYASLEPEYLRLLELTGS